MIRPRLAPVLILAAFFSLGMAPKPKPPPVPAVTSWWLSLDLGKTCPLSKITILWDSTYGSTNYTIQGSLDNSTWVNLQNNLSSAGGTAKEHALSGSYRYVRIYINKAAKTYPIIYETKLYGEKIIPPPPDTTAPTGSVKINNDAVYVNSTSVNLSLSASDSGSGMGQGSQMCFSNDGATWSNPEAYAAVKAWTLSSGSGAKTIYAKYKDAAGNWSAAYPDTVILDTTAPVTPLVSDDGATTISTTQLHTQWSSSDLESGIAEYLYRINRDTVVGETIIEWTSAGTAVEVIKTGLALVAGKTYYFAVKARNNAGLWSEIGYSDGIKITADTTPPTGSIAIDNGGAAYTNSLSVNLSLSAQDDENGSGLDKMCFSGDNKTWSSPESYNTAKTWALSSGDGQKTVYVKFSDKTANWSSVYSSGIILDTAPPIGSVVINNGDASSENWDVSLNLSAADTGSGMNSGAQMEFSNDNANWSNVEDYAAAKSWKLFSGFGAKTVYVKFKDAAGNWSSAYSDSINVQNVPKERIYIYLNGKRVAMEENGKKYFFHSDHLGSTSVVTDETAQQVKYLEYKPYGETKVEDGPKTIKRKFTGKELDDSTGLYDYGARMYEAGLGRFISADTVEPNLNNPQTLNRYSYTLNNPLKYIDPNGHEELEFQIMTSAALVTGYLIFKWTVDSIKNYIHSSPKVSLDLRLPGFSRAAPQSRTVESPSYSGLKYQPEGMSYADGMGTNVMRANGLLTIGYRYVGEKEAAEIGRTGKVPNMNARNESKNVCYTPDSPVDSASEAKKKYNLKNNPTHRVDLDISNTKADYGGNVEGGKGIEMTTRKQIPAKDVTKLRE
ncbi:MAG: RHS repeat-associated core domain-containing protein [Candidatus Omnitrophota bacterium]|nr:RHS repeat-associated core domain-containing protein [Candidatus Omnitrophota bacterium]